MTITRKERERKGGGEGEGEREGERERWGDPLCENRKLNTDDIIKF